MKLHLELFLSLVYWVISHIALLHIRSAVGNFRVWRLTEAFACTYKAALRKQLQRINK